MTTTKPKRRAAPAAKKRTRKATRTEARAAPTPGPTAEISVETLGRCLAETIRLYKEIGDDQSAVEQAVAAGTAKPLAKIEIDDYEDLVWDRKKAIESMIATVPAKTFAEAAIHIMIARAWTDILRSPPEGFDSDELHSRIENLLDSALAVLVREAGVDLVRYGGDFYTRPKLNPFDRRSVAPFTGHGPNTAASDAGAPAGPDPIIELVRRAREARERYDGAMPDDEREAFDKAVFKPAEEALIAAKPTTLEGVAAVLTLAVEALELDAPHLYRPLFETARDAVRGGVA